MLETGHVFVFCPLQLTEYHVTQACHYKETIILAQTIIRSLTATTALWEHYI